MNNSGLVLRIAIPVLETITLPLYITISGLIVLDLMTYEEIRICICIHNGLCTELENSSECKSKYQSTGYSRILLYSFTSNAEKLHKAHILSRSLQPLLVFCVLILVLSLLQGRVVAPDAFQF